MDKLNKLKYLCLHFDPYQEEIPPQILKLLAEFGVDPKQSDPFEITNQLLLMLDRYTELVE